MEQKVYRALVMDSQGRQGFVQFKAWNISDIEMVVTADPNGYEIVSLNQIGGVDNLAYGMRTVDATEFWRECKQTQDGYRGVELFPAE